MKYEYLNTPWEVVETPNKNIQIIDVLGNRVTGWLDPTVRSQVVKLVSSANRREELHEPLMVYSEYRGSSYEIDDFDFMGELIKL